MKTVVNENISCPTCGGHVFIDDFAVDGCYVCQNWVGKEKECNEPAACFCEGCNATYSKDRFGFRMEAFECKKCAHVQWGYTMFERDKRAFLMKGTHFHIKS